MKKIYKMNNEKKTIHEFNFDLICDYYSNTNRQGPGSAEITLKALSFIKGLTEHSKIADIACGTGGQTITIAQNVPSKIVGLDFLPGFINQFNHNVHNKNLQERVKGIVGDMKNLPFQKEEFDLIWSEGAIYAIGFERGLTEWKKYLKQGGYIAVTENTWFTKEQPREIRDFWNKAYPEIDTISNKVAQMQKAGFLPVATFIVPETCWDYYYHVQQPKMIDAFLNKYTYNKAVEEFIASQRYEVELYNKYKSHYGYVFYIGKKV